MDPDQALDDIHAAIRDLRDATDGSDTYTDAAETLTDRIEALDEWLTRGGMLPAAWARGGDQSPPEPDWDAIHDGG